MNRLPVMQLIPSIKLACVILFLVAATGLLFTDKRIVVSTRAFSGGPDPGRTGAPGELTCATGECHGSNKNTGPGKFSILAPREYEPGKTYEIEVRHTTVDLSRARWGFQMTSLNAANQKAGSFQNQEALTQIVEETLPGFQRQYIQHTLAGTFPEQMNVAGWKVKWTAPAADSGPITFFAAGNQADNNGNNSGDQIYTTQITITPAPPLPPPPAEQLRGGSVLIYDLYSSDASDRARHDTRISMTNAASLKPVTVHLFFVDGANGSIENAFLCLPPGKTISFLTSDIDPGTTGYLIAVATDPVTGCPVNANSLLGDAFIKLGTGQAANLPAEMFSMISDLSCPGTATAATLRFDGVNYSPAPRTVALAPIASGADGFETWLVMNRFGGDLRGSAPALSDGMGILFDDAANASPFSFSHSRAQLFIPLSEEFPLTTPRFPQVIPAGRSGWMKLSLIDDAPVTGAALAGGQGRSLQALTLSTTGIMTIPVYPPSC